MTNHPNRVEHFTMDNTDGFTQPQLDALNRRVADLLTQWEADLHDEDRYSDMVKAACDKAANEFIE